MQNSATFSDTFIDQKVSEIDNKFRDSFTDNIIEVKKLTHKCQYECYNKTNLHESEECARNCFLPMLFIKKNISKLIENSKEGLEKCKFNASSNNNDGKYYNTKIFRCLKNYEDDIFKTKDEADYIYKGYLKNFSELLKEENKKI